MRRTRFWIVTVLVPAVLYICRASWAQESSTPAGRDTLFEQEVEARLAAISQDAAVLFHEGTEASDSQQYELAKAKFEAVLQLVPGFADAERRLAYTEIQLDHAAIALAHAERALAADSSALNRSAVAYAILSAQDSTRYDEAFGLAKYAADAQREDLFVQNIFLWACLVNDYDHGIKAASERLTLLDPDNPAGHYYLGIALAREESWRASERELLKAQALGMESQKVEYLLAQGIRSHARLDRAKWWGLIALAAWAAGLGVLFVLGVVLSKATLSAVARTQSTGVFEISKGERLVRKLYSIVIGATSSYFYISIPFLLASVIVAAGAFLYICVQTGRIPIKLMLIIGGGALFTLFAVIRSLFVRAGDRDPGRRITREEAPGLWAVTEEVARKVETRPIQDIFLTPGGEIAVMERGKAWQKLRGEGRRCLVLGLAAVPGLKLGPFKSILAHEYGHFSHKDTAGGNLAHQIGLSMRQMVIDLVSNGLATWYNPAWWFVRGFSAVFVRTTQGASRLQEILADRIAAVAYGARSFVEGLTQVIRQSLVFEMQIGAALKKGLDDFAGIRNLYTLPSIDPASDEKVALDKQLQEILERPSSAYDSHPAPKERFELVRRLNLAGFAENGSTDVVQLLDAEKLQAEMTQIIQNNVKARHEALIRQQQGAAA